MGSLSCVVRCLCMCGESGSCNDRFGIVDGDSVCVNFMLMMYVWLYLGFEYWNVILWKVSDILWLLCVVVCVW